VFGKLIEAAANPFEQPIGRRTVQKIVADIRDESGRWQRRAQM
jgi:hypothetical protein